VDDKRGPLHHSRRVCFRYLIILLFSVFFALSYWVSTTALKRRFDSIEIGMPRYQVLRLLGAPQSQRGSDYFIPNYAELVDMRDGIVTHQKFGAFWKNYWLRTSQADRSDCWANNDKQIIVNYDGNRRISQIVWLERRTQMTPWLATLLARIAAIKDVVYEKKTYPL
jgi:hypothetical protein